MVVSFSIGEFATCSLIRQIAVGLILILPATSKIRTTSQVTVSGIDLYVTVGRKYIYNATKVKCAVIFSDLYVWFIT